MLWLWCRQEATGLIRPLAWELPSATGTALKKTKKKKKFNIESRGVEERVTLEKLDKYYLSRVIKANININHVDSIYS